MNPARDLDVSSSRVESLHQHMAAFHCLASTVAIAFAAAIATIAPAVAAASTIALVATGCTACRTRALRCRHLQGRATETLPGWRKASRTAIALLVLSFGIATRQLAEPGGGAKRPHLLGVAQRLRRPRHLP